MIQCRYCIVGKFGRENVQRIYSFQACGKRKFGKLINKSAKRLVIVSTNLDGFNLTNSR